MSEYVCVRQSLAQKILKRLINLDRKVNKKWKENKSLQNRSQNFLWELHYDPMSCVTEHGIRGLTSWPDLILLIEVGENCLQKCDILAVCICQPIWWKLVDFWHLPRKVHPSFGQIHPHTARKMCVRHFFEGNSRQPQLKGRGLFMRKFDNERQRFVSCWGVNNVRGKTDVSSLSGVSLITL